MRAGVCTMRRFRQITGLFALLSMLGGCAMYERYRPTYWPFPERELTTFHTPSMRVDAVHEFAAKSTGVDSPEQRQITDQLARQIQVEPDPLVRQAVVTSIAELTVPEPPSAVIALVAAALLFAGKRDRTAAASIGGC